MNNLASVYLRLYPNVPTKEHLSLFLKSYNIIRECAKREPMLYRTHLASTLYNVSASYIRYNKYDVAIKYIEKALKIDKELVLKSPEVHRYAINYSDDLERISGLYLWIIRDYIKAEEAAIEAVSSIENLYTYNHQVYLYTYVDKLYWLSNVYNEIGKCDEALDKSLCSLAILESANTCEYQTEKWIINIKNLLAEIYVKKLMYNEADAYSLDAFIIAKNLYIRAKAKENFDHYKLATKTRISVLREMSNYDAAESVISEYIALLNSHFGSLRESQILDFLEIKQELALIYRKNKKEYDKARVIYEELRNEYIKHYKSTISYADFLVEYALCCDDAGQHMEYEALLKDAIFEYCSIEDQTILVKENAATAYLLLALAISIDGDYEKAFESYEQSISLYNKVYRTEPLSVVGYLALAHRYYGLALEDSDIVKALEHYITAIDYYIEYDEDVSEINEVISELSGVISMLPEDVNQNIINLTYVLINKCTFICTLIFI